MILITDIEVRQYDCPRGQSNVIPKHDRCCKIHKHFIAHEAFFPNPQRREAAAVDINQSEVMQDRASSDARSAQTKECRSQRGKWNDPEDRKQKSGPNES